MEYVEGLYYQQETRLLADRYTVWVSDMVIQIYAGKDSIELPLQIIMRIHSDNTRRRLHLTKGQKRKNPFAWICKRNRLNKKTDIYRYWDSMFELKP